MGVDRVMGIDRFADLYAEVGLLLTVHMYPMAINPPEVDVGEDIFVGSTAKPEIADEPGEIGMIGLDVSSYGNDEGAVLYLEREFYAEFFSDHFVTGRGPPGISTKIKILCQQLFARRRL